MISSLEKLAFLLVTTTRKLRPYFQAHVINLDRSPAKEGHEQAGGYWTTNLVGSRT